MTTRTTWWTVAIVVVFGGESLCAQALKARLSVKVILDGNGEQPMEGAYFTDEQIEASVRISNELLAQSEAYWRFDLLEIERVEGVSRWIGDTGNCGQIRNGIESAAIGNPSLYAWREDAINVYITDKTINCWAICSFPGDRSAIVVNNSWMEVYRNELPPPYDFDLDFANGNTLLHEVGHFFNLCHTHGCPFGYVCLDADGDKPGGEPAGDDELEDTLPDLDCWSRDSIANWSFQGDYADLDTERQARVDATWLNVMGYHSVAIHTEKRAYLTAGQIERMAAEMHPVTGRRTHVLNLPRPAFTVTPEPVDELDEVAVDAALSVPDPGSAIVSYSWDFGDGTELLQSDAPTATHAYADPGIYTVRLTVTDDRGLWNITERTVVVRLQCELAEPWLMEDVGAPAFSGCARFEEGCVLVQGSAGTSRSRDDTLSLLHQKHSGAFRLTARIAQWNVGPSARLALMVRESLDADARYSSIGLRQLNTSIRSEVRQRETIGGPSGTVTQVVETAAIWLRIERKVDTVAASFSEDGILWDASQETVLEGLADEVLVGIAASGGSQEMLLATLCDLTLVELHPHFLRGDCNGDGAFDISDGTHNLNSLFGAGKPSNCTEACNANDDAQNDVSDAVYVFNFLFGSGEPPAAPYPDCGEDPEPAASLGCGRFGCE